VFIEANIWRPGGDDGELYEGGRVEVVRSDEDEIAVHLRIGSDEWGASFYLTRAMTGFLAASILAAAE
jgi:predicted RNase H-related nuclease YkuK (DUF458 family)